MKYDDIKHSNVITDGISFLKVVINKCEELAMQRGRNYDGGPGNNTRLKRKSGLTLETSAFLPFTVANLRFQPSC